MYTLSVYIIYFQHFQVFLTQGSDPGSGFSIIVQSTYSGCRCLIVLGILVHCLCHRHTAVNKPLFRMDAYARFFFFFFLIFLPEVRNHHRRMCVVVLRCLLHPQPVNLLNFLTDSFLPVLCQSPLNSWPS